MEEGFKKIIEIRTAIANIPEDKTYKTTLEKLIKKREKDVF